MGRRQKIKGNRVELEISKLFAERFKKPFSRVPTSGARVHQVKMTKTQLDMSVGDIVVPDNFRFSIEVKGGYPAINLTRCFMLGNGNATLDGFLVQAREQGETSDRAPMLVFKQDRAPVATFVLGTEFDRLKSGFKTADDRPIDCWAQYREWVAVGLQQLFRFQDEAFFF